MVSKSINPEAIQMTGSFDSPMKVHKRPSIHVKRVTASTKVSFWGKDNLEPQRIMHDIRSTPAIQSILKIKGCMLYGLGCFLGAVEDKNARGFEIIKPIKDAKIEAFLERSYFEQYIRAVCANYYNIENIFPEFILTKNRKEVYSINALKAAFSRWEVQNEKTGLIENLFYHSDWKSGRNNGSDALEIPVLNEYAPFEHLQDSKFHKCIYRYRDNTPDDRIYYQECGWNSIRTSEWLEVAQKIPQFKNKLFDNQAAIKYHVETSKEWWNWKYKGFDEMKQEDRIKVMHDERQKFENTMTGRDGAGKSLWTTGYTDHSGKYIQGWKIDTLSNKFGAGDYIEDMQEATAQILIALNFPPTLAGISPGKKFGAGSGSDIREAYNMYMTMQEIERDLILEPWYTAMRYNGYPSDIRLVFRYPIITTLDKNSETQTRDYATAATNE